MKPLLPSLREKKRYLVFQVISSDKFNYSEIKQALENSLQNYIGLLGSAQAGLQLLPEKWNQKKQIGIARINHRYVNHLKSALVLIEKIKNNRVILRSIGVSGILKKTQRFIK